MHRGLTATNAEMPSQTALPGSVSVEMKVCECDITCIVEM